MIPGLPRQNGMRCTKTLKIMTINNVDVWFAKFPLEEDASQFLPQPVIILNIERLEVLVKVQKLSSLGIINVSSQKGKMRTL